MKSPTSFLGQRPWMMPVAAGAIATAFAVAISIVTWRSEYERQAAYLETLAYMGERSLDTFFVQIRSSMAFLGEQIVEHRELDVPHAARARLLEFRARFPALTVVALVRADGQLLATTWASGNEVLPSIAAEADFAETLAEFTAGRDFTITRPLIGRVTRQWQISTRVPIRDKQGKLLYFLAAALPLTNTQDFWAGSAVPNGVVLGVVRDDGYLLVRHPTPANVSLEAQYRERLSGALYAHLRERNFPKAGLIEGHSSSTGERNLIAFRRFASLPLTFRVSVGFGVVRAQWWKTVLPIHALTLSLLAALVAVYLWQTRRQGAWDREREAQFTALEAANRELQRANDELDSFSYTVAHDLRAPVRALDGFSGLLVEEHGASLASEGRDLLARIRAANARMEALIDGMLTFARMSREPLGLRRIDTANLVASIAAEILPAGTPHALTIGTLPPCMADPVMLRAVWSNLLANAVKYSRHKEAPRIEVGFENGEYFVRDNGAGFDMAHAHNLFGAFQRLHAPSEFEGTGIGLAIVKRVVERHGGQVRAFGEVGEGAEFRFSLGDPGTMQSASRPPSGGAP